MQLLVHKEYSRWKGRTAAKTWQREKPWHIQGTPPECQIPRSLPPRDSAAECSQQSEQVKRGQEFPSWGGREGRPWQGQENPRPARHRLFNFILTGLKPLDNHFWLRHHPLSINKSPKPWALLLTALSQGRISWYEQLLLLLSLHLRPLNNCISPWLLAAVPGNGSLIVNGG